MGLEWFREARRTGVFNLFLDNRHVTYGGKIATVEIRLQPTVPRAQTAAELRSLIARRQRSARAMSFSSTPVPYARPFLPSRGPSRWGASTAGSHRDAPSLHDQGEGYTVPSDKAKQKQMMIENIAPAQVLQVAEEDKEEDQDASLHADPDQPLSPFSLQEGMAERGSRSAFCEGSLSERRSSPSVSVLQRRPVTTAPRAATSLAEDNENARPASVAVLSVVAPQRTSPSRRQVVYWCSLV